MNRIGFGVDMHAAVELQFTFTFVCMLMEHDCRVNSSTALECNQSITLKNSRTSLMKCMFWTVLCWLRNGTCLPVSSTAWRGKGYCPLSVFLDSAKNLSDALQSLVSIKSIIFLMAFIVLLVTSLSVSLQPFETALFSIMLGKHSSNPLAATSSIFMRSHVHVPEMQG